MTKNFSDLKYERPDYKTQKEKLNELKRKMIEAKSYEEIRNAWLAMKETMYKIDYYEEIAYLKYLCGIDFKYNSQEVEIQSKEDPILAAIQNECNQVLLDSSFISEFEKEFGSQIVKIMKNNQKYSDEAIKTLQAEENQFMNKYVHLVAVNGRTKEMNYLHQYAMKFIIHL